VWSNVKKLLLLGFAFAEDSYVLSAVTEKPGTFRTPAAKGWRKGTGGGRGGEKAGPWLTGL